MNSYHRHGCTSTYTYPHTLKISFFYKKTNKSKANLRVKCFITAKNFAGGNVPWLPSPGPSHLQNLTPKCKVLKRVFVVTCK